MTQDKLTRDATRGREKDKSNRHYDLSVAEIDNLYKGAKQIGGVEGFFMAICAAFDCGFERGARMTKNNHSRKAKRKAATE